VVEYATPTVVGSVLGLQLNASDCADAIEPENETVTEAAGVAESVTVKP
jgi:hypothetical protein